MIGKTILHYKIIDKLGEGGMGIVYKAEDTKLNRDVAIKILPPHLLVSEEDRARFDREAKAAAALHHPHIATVFEINEYDGTPFIVMEYIEGHTLDYHINKEPFKLPDVISIAIQLTEGLKAAHSKDIIHRDIKSSNVLLGPDNQIKILDFGLAKTSMSTKLTKMGSTIGTVAFMSPEQVAGKEVDHRTDLWSLGVLIYELISGRLPFTADYDSAIFYAIQNEEPEALTSLRTGVPLSLEWIVSKLMAKEPNERYQHTKDLIIDLKAVDLNTTGMSRKTTSTMKTISKPSPQIKKRSINLSWILTSLTIIFSLFLIWLLLTKNEISNLSTQRYNISAIHAENQQFIRIDVQVLALSPDGKNIVYCLIDKGNNYLFLRSLASYKVRRLEGTQNALEPFFSPDGQWIGFIADGKIKKVSISGGAVEIIGNAPGIRGASWGPDDRIIFSPSYASGLMSVAASGGDVKMITELDTLNKERTHRWPQILPDGKHVMYTIGNVDNPNSYVDAQIAIQSLENGDRNILDLKGEMARYIEPGYLLVARNGRLLAAPFSLDNFKTLKPLISVVDDIDGDAGSGISYFSVSSSGNLIYIPGTRDSQQQMVWITREGNIHPLPLAPNSYSNPSISPDGKMIAVNIGQLGAVNEDIWIYDISQSLFNRFTFGMGNFYPVWRNDGAGIFYNSIQNEVAELKYKSFDGTSSKTILEYSTNITQYPISVSPDDGHLILNRLGGVSEGDILIVDINGNEEPEYLINAPVFESGGEFSPDGKYLVYSSNETGRLEIYIRTFPNNRGKWQISAEGGFSPKWSTNGKEIFYVNNVGKMMVVPIKNKPFFTPGKAEVLFDVSQMNFPSYPVANYDIAPDDKRFLMIKNIGYQTNIRDFNIITNWLFELAERFSEDT